MNALGPLALLVAGTVFAAPALAQTTVTRSETVPPGKPVRVLVASNLKKDCSAGAMPEIKIATAPKNGSIVTKTGKLKTPATSRCPNKETDVQVLFYQSKPGFSGADQLLLEIKTADGNVLRQDIRISVDATKKDEKKEDGKDKPGVTEL